MSQLKRFPYAGAIDADGHILEPPDLWEKYIKPKYRDRTIRIRKNHEGLEVLELAGGSAKYMRPGQLAQFGAMGKSEEDTTPHPDRTGNYMEELQELVEPLSASTRQKIIGENVARAYGV